MTHQIVVVTAGLSDPSSTRLLADLLAGAAGTALPEAEVTVIELRPLAHALTDHLLTGFATGELAEALAKVAAADGLIVVSPVFSASYSGLFKTFFDVLETGALDGTPVLIAATAGTARHSLVLEHALRPLFSYLHAVVVPTGVFAATDDFAGDALRRRVDRAAAELAALVAARPRTAKPDQFDRDLAAMGDFESLLNG
ncbi:NADPH-dependent FMN reductase [Nocardioides marmoriginsengisoli]|uniref:NADPH-dependent FMN reductase n=1 Tax=Nocardioides marmoriginsengisoli TaxID=661483 RepID=A0A3N0CC11_9ACTN|nr:CE1759 family FMN reductase [Nocardioides marmoriginsengisoli]RNL60606.1 NADPH-dependent FMN reductase [Nocardioides marmoriginsengisoli]